ncbi:phosphonate ABC transporter, permease protein PhnE [Desulfobacula phenolica]|uniref:Phosphonate transport system permease protein n=1 Tax=Desulfobacula phenolica TaxID=90732 RepID=A0A1H2H2U6_9BACT|nr:phosphonate ABC transporter, permease protein PhnE [Desulfobacula phenolica]SDU26115.1 phosphonate transport system permease protein [Desulfobacula phenolica]
MTKGYRIWVAIAGSMLVAGFFLPWLVKTPFFFSGLFFATLGHAFLFILPISGIAAVVPVLINKRPRPYQILYPGMAGILILEILISVLIFKDSGVLMISLSSPAMEIIKLNMDTSMIFFHPLKDLGPGLILNFAGICILCLLPFFYKNQYQTIEKNQNFYRHIIQEPAVSIEYKRFGMILSLFTVLIITYAWCDVSPTKLWENRGNAKEYLFGRQLSQSDMEYINNQEKRALEIEAAGLAREFMSNKYRDVVFSQQPNAEQKAKERDAVKQKLLAQMEEQEKQLIKNEARKNALIDKRGGYFPPETSLPKIRGYIIALIETVAIAIWGTLLAVICAIPISFFAAKNTLKLIISSEDLKSRSIRSSITFFVRRFLDSCRGFNEFVMALIFVAVIGLGPYAGILALWIHTFGILGKVFSEQIEAIESGQVEALTSTGAGAFQIIAFSVMPQIMPVLVSYTLLRFESNVRSAAILGFVGAGGIGFLIFDKLNGYLFREVCTMMIIIIMTVGIIDHFCGKIRMKFI